MKNPLTWLVIACIIIGLLVAGCIWLGYGKYTYKKSSDGWQMKYGACMSAPVTSDTVHDTVWHYDTTWIKLKGKPYPVHDTTIKWCQAFFDSTYKFQNNSGSGRIHYRIDIRDCRASIQFPDIVAPKEIITITDHRDTCITKPPAYTPKNHWIIEGNLIGNSITKFPNFDLGFSYSIKDRIKINLGGEYNMYHGEAYVKAGIGYYLK